MSLGNIFPEGDRAVYLTASKVRFRICAEGQKLKGPVLCSLIGQDRLDGFNYSSAGISSKHFLGPGVDI